MTPPWLLCTNFLLLEDLLVSDLPSAGTRPVLIKGFRPTMETPFWMCLWRYLQEGLTEIFNSECGWHHPCSGARNKWKRASGLRSSLPPFLLPDRGCHVTTCFRLLLPPSYHDGRCCQNVNQAERFLFLSYCPEGHCYQWKKHLRQKGFNYGPLGHSPDSDSLQ